MGRPCAFPSAFVSRAVLIFALALCTGCFTVDAHETHREPTLERIPWLTEGRTTRSEVTAHLGEPSRIFEQGRIQIWALDDNLTVLAQRQSGAAPYAPPVSLVVVFDAGDVVEHASVVHS